MGFRVCVLGADRISFWDAPQSWDLPSMEPGVQKKKKKSKTRPETWLCPVPKTRAELRAEQAPEYQIRLDCSSPPDLESI